MIERSQTQQWMDQLEELVLRRGWPVPFTPYYLVNHEKLLFLMDQLRISLQEEMDGRFIKSFARTEAPPPKVVNEAIPSNRMGKER